MSTDSMACKACNYHLEHSDVRQLAVYYRTERASLVAVQYVCPRCGATEWQRYEAEDWPLDADLVAELTSNPPLPLPALGPPAAAREQDPDGFAADPACAIGTDELIEFGLRLQRLDPDDLRRLRAELAGGV